MPSNRFRLYSSFKIVARIGLLAFTAPLAAQNDSGATNAPSAATPDRPRYSFDPATGRDLLNYPPHRSADLLHERLELIVPDMNTPRVLATATIRFTPISGDLTTLRLHAAELFIKSIVSDGRTATFAYAPGEDNLSVTLDPPVPFGSIAEVRIDYELNDPAEGIIWTPESKLWPGRAASFHSQGEPESNRYWFPTFDFPSERLSSEVIVTVPPGYTAVSNGRLARHEHVMMPDKVAGGELFHYVQEKEHAPYLISLSVGKWDVVDVAPAGGSVPMPVYAPAGQGDRVKSVFGRTPRMVALYERLFDEPYAWAQYAQVVVNNFAWGGMENTSATTLFDSVALDKIAMLDGDQDELICHELAHQWFGDLLTCRSWEHIWLNEGWATFSEGLWEQYRHASLDRRDPARPPTAGLDGDDDAYQYAVWKWYRDVIEHDKAEAPYQPPMVSKEYAYPDAVFDRAANPYPKGASIMHMLRSRLGEETFWRGTALYLDRHHNQPVETFQFRLCMEEVSGLSLQRFFDQWCYRPGVPHLHVTHAWDSATRTLTINVEQTQSINGANPAFDIELPILIDIGERTPREALVRGDDRTSSLSITLPREPRGLIIDPQLSLLADITLDCTSEQAGATLKAGPTLASRLLSVRRAEATGNFAALAAAARDSRAFFGLRVEAITALGRMSNPDAGKDDDEVTAAGTSVPTAPSPGNSDAYSSLIAMTRDDIADARLRAPLVEALGDGGQIADRELQRSVITWLMERWEKDPSYAVRAECLRSLGKLKAVDAIKLLDAGLITESQHDQIRVAAVEGYKEADFPGGLDRAADMTTPDHTRDVRQASIKAIAALADQDRERAFNLLAALINDADMRTRRVAVESLLELDDPRALPTVEQWSDAARGTADKLWGRDLLRRHADEERAEAPVAEPTDAH